MIYYLVNNTAVSYSAGCMALPILQSDTLNTRPSFDDILKIRVLKDDEGSEDGQEEGVERQVHVEILPKG